MVTVDPQPRLIKTQEQHTAVMRERVAMTRLTDFFARAFGAVKAAAQAQHAHPTGPPSRSTMACPRRRLTSKPAFP